MSVAETGRPRVDLDFVESADFISRQIDFRNRESEAIPPHWLDALSTLDREVFTDDVSIYDLLDPKKAIGEKFQSSTHDPELVWFDKPIAEALMAASQLIVDGQPIRYNHYPIIVRIGLIRGLDVEHLKRIDGLGKGAFILKKLFGSA